MNRRRIADGSEDDMSVSKPYYDPRYCDGYPCVGDCDLCSMWVDFEEYDDGEDKDDTDTDI